VVICSSILEEIFSRKYLCLFYSQTSRNNSIFEKIKCYSPVQVIITVVHWMHLWVFLQCSDARDLVMGLHFT
jgi:hypothetical protein